MLSQSVPTRFKPYRLLALLLALCWLSSPVYAMSSAKQWVNKLRPGTFADSAADASADALKQQERKFSESEMKVLTALKAREDELNRKEAEYVKKTQELKQLSQQIEQKLDQMRVLQSQIEEERTLRKSMDEKDISRMVKYYETMASENTATFFNRMDRDTATQLLMRMNPRKASAVMQLLNPKVAVEITERVTRFKENQSRLSPNR